MLRKWIVNADRSRAHQVRNDLETTKRNVFLIGRPLDYSGVYSVEQLETMNLVGIYMEESQCEGKPNPDCPDCHGTGSVLLFMFTSPCKCLSKPDNPPKAHDDWDDYNGYWE